MDERCQPFCWPVRVYWEDTDGGGVVYHARYLNYFERARTEWLRAAGFEQSMLHSRHDLVFAVRRMEIDFRRAARLDDQLEVTVTPGRIGKASMELGQRMCRADSGELIATASVYAACLTASTFKPRRIPAIIHNKLEIA